MRAIVGRVRASLLMRLILIQFVLISFIAPASSHSFNFWNETAVVSLKQRTALTLVAQQLGGGGFSLAGGEYISLSKWYQPKNPDFQIDFLTQLSPNAGILWGLSTGEYAKKYSVDPSFKLGFIFQYPLSSSSRLSFSFTQLFAGGLKEKTCMADYGDIGGVQTVNCRLAASTLEPATTLNYLARIPAPDRNWLNLRFNMNF